MTWSANSAGPRSSYFRSNVSWSEVGLEALLLAGVAAAAACPASGTAEALVGNVFSATRYELSSTCGAALWSASIPDAAKLAEPADPSLVHRPCQSRLVGIVIVFGEFLIGLPSRAAASGLSSGVPV